MAQLDVQLKKSTPWWLWLLLLLVALAILFFVLKGRNNKTNQVATTDSNSTETVNSSEKSMVAVTQPDFNNVDFNSPTSGDPDVTDKDISVSGNEKYTIYTLGENILFASDKNTVQGSADAKLKQISASLDKHYKNANIGVYGNTDSTGTTSHNKQLGAERATAVKEWLVKNAGFDSSLVSVHSFGAAKPVASNATAKGRKQNRNVEIVAFRDSSSHNN